MFNDELMNPSSFITLLVWTMVWTRRTKMFVSIWRLWCDVPRVSLLTCRCWKAWLGHVSRWSLHHTCRISADGCARHRGLAATGRGRAVVGSVGVAPGHLAPHSYMPGFILTNIRVYRFSCNIRTAIIIKAILNFWAWIEKVIYFYYVLQNPAMLWLKWDWWIEILIYMLIE